MIATSVAHDTAVDSVHASAYKIPTDRPEADGTANWEHTTLVCVDIRAGDTTGFGYTYADEATAHLIHESLARVIQGRDALDIPVAWAAMVHAIRNLGRPGIASMAISAVDAALWDLKGRLLEQPVVALMGAAREAAPIYGSGGFTSYSNKELCEQLAGWVHEGIPRVKMKIGTHPDQDVARVKAARDAIGDRAELFVDGNGAYSRKQALAFAYDFTDLGVSWFEEPVTSDDLEGLHLIRDRGPAGMDIAVGEYGYDQYYFRRMLEAGAVDVLQADASRCGGPTGFLRAAAVCDAWGLPLSAHCAPSLHVHVACAAPRLRHIEYFHDHVRIEHMLFDGGPDPVNGALRPDRSRPGLGFELKRADAEQYAVWESS